MEGTRVRWVLAGFAVAVLVGQAVVLALWPGAHLLLIDLQVYRAGGEHVLHGDPLYDGGVLLDLPFVYPPFAAVLFAPLALLPVGVLKIFWTGAGIGLLGYVVHRCGRAVGVPGGVVPGGVVTVVVLTVVATGLDPVRTTLYLGQINVVLLALVVGDLLGRRESRWRGVGLGLAAAVKLTPLLFVVYLLAVGRRRAAATAVAVFAGAGVLGFVLAPADSAAYWFRGTFAAADRISDVAGLSNHSLNGLLARLGVAIPVLGSPVVWAVSAVLLGGVTVGLAVRAHRAGEEVLALTLCGLACAALAPFAWSHHWVWVVPAMVLLVQRAVAGARSASALLCGLLVVTLAVITRLPGPGVGPIPATGLISLQPDVYLLLYAGALVAAAWVLRSPGSRRPATPITGSDAQAGPRRSQRLPATSRNTATCP